MGRAVSSILGWYIEGQVLYTANYGSVTIEGLRATDEMIQAHLHAHPAGVHVITDNTQLEQIPVDISYMQQAMQGMQHPSLRWVIHVGNANIFIRVMARIISRVARISYQSVETIEEALDFLKLHAPHLDWDRANPDVLRGKPAPEDGSS